MGAVDEDHAVRVRSGVAASEREGTARIRYVARMLEGLGLANALEEQHPAAGALARKIGRTLRRGPQGSSSLPGPDGIIDFIHRRSLYSNGGFWKLYADGFEYLGRPGEWEADGEILPLGDDDPFWLLALISRTVEATAGGEEFVLSTRCQRYSGYADFESARRAADREMVPPSTGDHDLKRLPIEVWIDPVGRIRQAILRGRGEWQWRLELHGYGEPDPIHLPRQDEILPEDG